MEESITKKSFTDGKDDHEKEKQSGQKYAFGFKKSFHYAFTKRIIKRNSPACIIELI